MNVWNYREMENILRFTEAWAFFLHFDHVTNGIHWKEHVFGVWIIKKFIWLPSQSRLHITNQISQNFKFASRDKDNLVTRGIGNSIFILGILRITRGTKNRQQNQTNNLFTNIFSHIYEEKSYYILCIF